MDETENPLLEVADLGHYGWHPAAGLPGTYLDQPSFNYVHFFVTRDGMSGSTKATVLFAGTPVLLVWHDQQEYRYELPVLSDHEHVMTQTHFLVEIGEATEAADEWQVDHPDESVWETEHVGDGHELVHFVGHVARALYARFPDELDEPTGF